MLIDDRVAKAICKSACVQMARDVANGMSCMHDLGFVHRDLAARNVLVDSLFRCRIGDFGHTRKLTKDLVYKCSEPNTRYALRWLAPEAAKDQVFSEHSDVWAFGILMFEIWTSGEMPYKDWNNAKVRSEVCSNFYVLPCPPDCNSEHYKVMKSCWSPNPSNRPKFKELLEFLSRPELIQDSTNVGWQNSLTDAIKRSSVNSAIAFKNSQVSFPTRSVLVEDRYVANLHEESYIVATNNVVIETFAKEASVVAAEKRVQQQV